ncbi:hypothetical protein [Dyadobacter psychrotolerans]|uniref:Uncharacterized protein n=1 Tax=Dyadobacter psychrotolerans TaxID=2541721 RepID=A0A4R5DAW8_9BACT|nr:hypothetical protein [Dyadobacter psychrotolerans]TDE10812.1 hypothetical protein E0F88_27450 [Dyadobacter psychrotolerans]
MTKKRILIGMLILFVATALQSQQPSKRLPAVDSARKDTDSKAEPLLLKKSDPQVVKKTETTPVDSNEILKKQINVVNTDIYKTADRIDYKIGRLPVLVQRAVVYKNRTKPEVSSIQPPEIPVSVPEPMIDTLPPEQVTSRFLWLFKRKK